MTAYDKKYGVVYCKFRHGKANPVTDLEGL
jgi:hypothetical protein